MSVLCTCGGSAGGAVKTSGGARAEVEVSGASPSSVVGASEATREESGESSPPARSSPLARSRAAAALSPRYEPNLVREALDRTAAAPDERARLGVRLSLVDQGPDAPWLIAIVNRGTEPIRVVPDLRTLSLTITAPPPGSAPGKRAKSFRAPKPVTCALPRDLAPNDEDATLSTLLEPGEGLIDSFDPRLYCLSMVGPSPLVPGATVVARLGWAEKIKTVWRQGKREPVLLEQSPPFLVRRVVPEGALASTESESESESESVPDARAPSASLHSDADGIKQLVAQSISLGPEYAPVPAPPDPQPLGLVLTRGSDAKTEREATLSVTVVNRGKRPERVFFRRELLSFEVSGPSGVVSCEPGPDSRAPDPFSVSVLQPGAKISATSRLVELCPPGAFRRPGLYLVHARFEGVGGASDPNLPPAFAGRLVSRAPAQIRVRQGWGRLPPQREPERVRVGMH